MNSASVALTEAVEIWDVKGIRDKAEVLRAYARQSGESVEVINLACELKIRAERKAGAILRGMELQGPGEYKRLHDGTVCPSLADIGISKAQSHRWQVEADVPDAEFEVYVHEANSDGRELTSAAIYKLGKRWRAANSPSESGAEPIEGVFDDFTDIVQAGHKFGTIYADPPWKYGNQATRASTGNHYSTMSIDELCEMDVSSIAADDAHLHLWTTNAFLFDAKTVLESWGFTYKSCFVWVKPQMGIGNYWRVSHEFLLLGVRGNAKRFLEHNHKSWIELKRSQHSKKPPEVQAIIEKVSNGPFIELFGRRQVTGWTIFGNQVEKSLF